MAEEPKVSTVSTKNEEDPEFSQSGDLSGDGGVMKEILRHGEQGWLKPEKGDEVRMHYRGTLLDGTEFDSSYARNTPFVFRLGEGKVIKGWDIVGLTMCKGEKAKVTLKSDYAYGESGSPPKIPANATLVFEMELLSWTSKRDVFGDGVVIKSEVEAGVGWERPGKLAEVTVNVVVVKMDEDGRSEGPKIHESDMTFTLGSGLVPEAWEKVIPDMKKGGILHLVCKPPRLAGPGVNFVPEGTTCVRYQLTLMAWKKIEDIHSDGTLVKKVLQEGEGWERPTEGADAVVTIKYYKPVTDPSSCVPDVKGDPIYVVADLKMKVGDGVTVDGIDRAVQSMKLNEKALLSVDAKHAFKTAPTLLPKELSDAGIAIDSRIIVELELSKIEKARDVWSMSLDDKVEEMKVRKQCGNELFKQGRFATAKKSYDRAVNFFDSPTSDLKPEMKSQVNELLVQCHLNLAMCSDRMGDVMQVLVHCRKALEIQPSNVKALYRQGCAYLSLEDYFNASSSLKYARELSPGNVEVQKKLRELKEKRSRQDALDKKLFSNLFGRLSKLEEKEVKKPDGTDVMETDKVNGTGENKTGLESVKGDDVNMVESSKAEV